MAQRRPLVAVAAPEGAGLAEAVLEAGGEPLEVPLPAPPPEWGVALAREWAADALEVRLRTLSPGALLFDARSAAGLAGAFAAALRVGLPAVCASPPRGAFAAALAGLGARPLREEPAACAVRLAEEGRPRAGDLVESFALANALRAAAAMRCGPEAFVHLAALAREAEVQGFDRMVRVMVPDVPGIARPGSPWLRQHGLPGLLSRLGDDLHGGALTVCGRLEETLPPELPPPPEDPPAGRYVFVEARASGAEALCSLPAGAEEPAGECSVYLSEKSAARAVRWERVEPGSLIVVVGCGPRGAPGLRRLDALGEALREAGLRAPVLTDGLAPEGEGGTWVSMFTPESAARGVIGRLRQGDFLRIDLERRAIRTSADPEKFSRRDYFGASRARGYGYAARYARSALPALEGAGFG
ncbi:Dihydroxyacid dehydratase/phosphogluconate dehydratase-like protein [Rubrobacter xylanophilus DSM 9941]|uniref:Dihydroxyacid dehydratase/phosphogluconate dehydratase-like protein n=1 Tax=Rubrobacter xylanophilus (strain DSM 9941 / JCM 11954 / NBRC 16129 / PRD-1) TaxID=266117 RepID=Q1AXS5_RUBXD|nr:dihydroxy-acid dehydratase [Rubrobacter xylanophilus]ABG03803.1 Dihydroxyacid dehydratase/phosphogluconate dehydratase-like protein [Rubrobacter xylanophilus DSM 9941]